jgi:hypothetical protein
MTTTQVWEYEVTEAGRIYWALRNRLGQFVTRHGLNRSRKAEQLAAWRAYLDARRDAADAATRGHLTTDWTRSTDALFRPGASLRGASPELLDWFEENGPTLHFRAFAATA